MVKRLFLFGIGIVLVASLAWAADVQLKDGGTNLLDDDLFSAYANLVAASKVGTGAAQVSAGDHAHTGMLSGPLSATAGAMVCTTGTAQYTGAACAGVGTAGLMKWGVTGIPATATAVTDYVAVEADPVVKAINGIVKSNTSTIAVATRADYASAQIIGDSTTPINIAAGYTLDIANSYGFELHTTGTGSVALPAITGVAGPNGCISMAATANTLTLTPNGTEKIRSAGADKATLTLTGSNDGYVCIISDGVKWRRLGYEGTLGGT